MVYSVKNTRVDWQRSGGGSGGGIAHIPLLTRRAASRSYASTHTTHSPASRRRQTGAAGALTSLHIVGILSGRAQQQRQRRLRAHTPKRKYCGFGSISFRRARARAAKRQTSDAACGASEPVGRSPKRIVCEQRWDFLGCHTPARYTRNQVGRVCNSPACARSLGSGGGMNKNAN